MAVTALIRDICGQFSMELCCILGTRLFGVYVYGAAAFPDTLPTGDIDFHVILNSAVTGDERRELEAMHEMLAARFPPLGGEMDGYYILVDDTRTMTPPRSLMWECATDESWALHCAHIHAGRVITLSGPDPRSVYPVPEWPDLEAALRHELDYVRIHLADYPDYCILNLCRIVLSFRTRNVAVSKAGAADWALKNLPHWRSSILLALKSYSGTAEPADRQQMQSAAGALYRESVFLIRDDLS